MCLEIDVDISDRSSRSAIMSDFFSWSKSLVRVMFCPDWKHRKTRRINFEKHVFIHLFTISFRITNKNREAPYRITLHTILRMRVKNRSPLSFASQKLKAESRMPTFYWSWKPDVWKNCFYLIPITFHCAWNFKFPISGAGRVIESNFLVHDYLQSLVFSIIFQKRNVSESREWEAQSQWLSSQFK